MPDRNPTNQPIHSAAGGVSINEYVERITADMNLLLTRRIDDLVIRFDQRSEMAEERFEQKIAELVIRFDQRAEASEKAVVSAVASTDKATAAAFAAAKEAVNAAFQAAEKSTAAAMVSAQTAVSKAEATTDKRLEGMNEVRDQLGTQAATMVLKVQHDAEIAALTERQNEMKARLDLQAGKTSGFTTGWGILVAIIGVLFAVASFAMRFVK